MAFIVLTLLACCGAAWYLIIWTICLFGLFRARVMFGGSVSERSGSREDERYKRRQRRISRPSDEDSESLLGQTASSLNSSGVTGINEAASLPGVSILRPLSGIDSNLYHNLASTFTQTYPTDKYEVLFSVAAPTDAALPIAQAVLEKYKDSGVKARILIGSIEAGVNPKINNLLRSYVAAENDIFWVVDSQVLLSPGTLLDAVTQFTCPPRRPSPTWLRRKPHGTRIGLLHHVPFAVLSEPGMSSSTRSSSSLGSQIERTFLCTTHAKMYIAINSLSVDSCVMGKSNMWRRSDLERVPDEFFGLDMDGHVEGSAVFDLPTDHLLSHGSPPDLSSLSAKDILILARPLARFSIYLAEDNMLALSLWRPPLSLSHTLASGSASLALTNVSDINSVRAYFDRRVRWIRVRRYMVPEATWAEPLTESIVSGFLGLFGLTYLSYWPSGLLAAIGFLLLHFSAWLAVDLCVYATLNPSHSTTTSSSTLTSSMPRPLPSFIRSWLLREILALPIWLTAMFGSRGNRVKWRGREYWILPGARAARVRE